jgi:hypothetical protein
MARSRRSPHHLVGNTVSFLLVAVAGRADSELGLRRKRRALLEEGWPSYGQPRAGTRALVPRNRSDDDFC